MSRKAGKVEIFAGTLLWPPVLKHKILDFSSIPIWHMDTVYA